MWALLGAAGSQLVVQSSDGATSTWSVNEHHTRVSDFGRGNPGLDKTVRLAVVGMLELLLMGTGA